MNPKENKSQKSLSTMLSRFGEDLDCVIIVGLLKNKTPVLHHSDQITQMEKAFLLDFLNAWSMKKTLEGYVED